MSFAELDTPTGLLQYGTMVKRQVHAPTEVCQDVTKGTHLLEQVVAEGGHELC